MKIYTPQYLNEIGKRANNEDRIFPIPGEVSPSDQLFLVCDGVGGQEKGEVASALICKHLPAYVKDERNRTDPKQLLPEALAFTEQKMRTYIKKHPSSAGMASTLTCALLKSTTAVVGWVGDSRIYHIRAGKVLFQTKDHSHVQLLIDQGELTEQEARLHPRRNIILRAINGDQPVQLDQQILTDLYPDDFLLLCSDGLLETLDTEKIQRWFTRDQSPEQLKSLILENAKEQTQDNYSMYLLKIREVDANEDRTQDSRPHGTKNPVFSWLIFAGLILLILLLALLYTFPGL